MCTQEVSAVKMPPPQLLALFNLAVPGTACRVPTQTLASSLLLHLTFPLSHPEAHTPLSPIMAFPCLANPPKYSCTRAQVQEREHTLEITALPQDIV